MKSKITRIPTELDESIKKIAQKNNLRYSDAARELARISDRLKNKGRIIREIKF